MRILYILLLTSSLAYAQNFYLSQFKAVGDGITPDTSNIQSAIDAASAVGGRVVGEKGKIYSITGIIPKSNVVIDLQGSTLKLADGSNCLLIDGTGAPGRNFSINNGVLDMNKAHNNAPSNQCAGGAWFVNWGFLHFQDVIFQNAFRTSLVLNSCSDIDITNVSNLQCGTSNSQGLFGYALEAYNMTSRLKVNNFKVDTMYGFGIHLYNVTDCDLSNLEFNNLTQNNTAIAITGTQASRCNIRNVKAYLVDGIAVEINACNDFRVSGIYAEGCQVSSLVMGDNGSGLYNEHVIIDGLTSVLCGGDSSVKINWAKNCTFENMTLDKGITTLGSGANLTNDRSNIIRNSSIAANITSDINYFGKFNLERLSFNNFYVEHLTGNTARFSNPMLNGDFGLTMPNGSSAYINMNDWNNLGPSGLINGRLCISSLFNNQQSTYQEMLFTFNNTGTAANLSTPMVVSNAIPRLVTVTGDPINKRFVLTNSTGVAIIVHWVIESVGR